MSSLWIGLVTPVDAGVARPLVEGLRTETVVTDPSGMALFDVEPTGFEEACDGRSPKTVTSRDPALVRLAAYPWLRAIGAVGA